MHPRGERRSPSTRQGGSAAPATPCLTTHRRNADAQTGIRGCTVVVLPPRENPLSMLHDRGSTEPRGAPADNRLPWLARAENSRHSITKKRGHHKGEGVETPCALDRGEMSNRSRFDHDRRSRTHRRPNPVVVLCLSGEREHHRVRGRTANPVCCTLAASGGHHPPVRVGRPLQPPRA